MHPELEPVIPEWIHSDREAMYYFLLKAAALDGGAAFGANVLLADEIGSTDCDLAQAFMRLHLELTNQSTGELVRMAEEMRATRCRADAQREGPVDARR